MIKKLGIIFTIGVIILGIVVYADHKIESSAIEREFGVNMSNMNIDKKYRKEEWAPNGDGEQFLNITKGYYKYVVYENDDWNFGILIVDTTRKEICIYYQIL